MTPSLITALLVATAVAVVSAWAGSRASTRLGLIVPLAAGALLGVAMFDLLPEGKADLTWPLFLGFAAAGYVGLWLVGRFVFDVCPACSLDESDRKASVVLLSVALGVHCLLDGVALASGAHLSPQAAWAALFGIGLHKFPEGLALGLLLAKSGLSRARTMGIAAGVEGLTIVGGVAGAAFLSRPDPRAIGALLAIVGGGFVYLVVAALGSGSITARLRWISTGVASFLATGALFWLAART